MKNWIQKMIYDSSENYEYYYYDDYGDPIPCESSCNRFSQKVKYSVGGEIFEYFFADLWEMRDIECPEGSKNEGNGCKVLLIIKIE